MKFTAVFLGNKNNVLKELGTQFKTKYKTDITKITKNVIFYLYIGVLVIAFSFFARYIKITPKILYFATNFRQAQYDTFEVADLLNIYSIYNKNNYIINTSLMDNKEENEQNKQEVYNSDYEALDSVAEEAKAAQVFFSKPSQVTVTENSASIQRVTINTMKVLNYSTNRNIDFKTLADSRVTLTKSSDKILLYNTHTSETYANSEKYQFGYTGTRRTTDANYNMLKIASEFANNLNSKGFIAVHDTTPHDYGAYTNSYARSKITVQNALKNMGGAGISIDVHRDAIADLDFAPSVEIKGVRVAQLMFVMGVGSDTTKNPYYEDNLKLAFRIQQLADEVYPGLFRPMIIRNSVYNQDLNRYSLLVEVGASGNTIEQAELATRCLTNLLNIIYKD